MTVIYLIVALTVLSLAAVFLWILGRRVPVGRLLGLRLFSIRIPKEDKKEIDLNKEIGSSEQLLSALAGIKDFFIFEAAVHHIGEEIHFYVAVKASAADFIKRQIQGLWPGAEVKEIDDYNIFTPHGSSAGSYLGLKNDFILPIRTYQEVNVDTAASILSHLSKLEEIGEGAALQVIFRPAPKFARKRILGAISRLRKGESAEDVLGGGGAMILKELQKVAQGIQAGEKPAVVDENLVQALQRKVSKPLLEVNFRLVAAAPTQMRADEILSGLNNSFSQFSAPLRNEIKTFSPRSLKNFNFDFIFRNFNSRQAMILNTEELTSLFHLPAATTVIPRIRWLKSKEAAPPSNLPADGVLIGESVFRGQIKPVRLSYGDRERHLYVIGQTGTGKTTFLSNLVNQDIGNGEGVCVIDPHGDFVNDVLAAVPERRFNDVIFFDPTDIWHPLGLNMLEYDPNRPEEKTFIVNEMQSIFNKLFPPETMGPMFEQYMRNALLLLMEDFVNEPATLIEVPRVFTDAEWRRNKLSRIHNPAVIDFWEKEAVKAGGEASLQNMTPYITSKFNNFIANDYLRPIIGQPKSAFNFRQALDEGKIILINLAKGRLGDINAHLLGMIVVGKLLMAALGRVDLPQDKRRRFHLFIDEFHNFTTDSISVILSEARKYKLSLNIAHQFVAQLSDKIRDSVFGNVGSLASFRVGIQDAESLIKHFEPDFSVNDLINLDNFNACAKILIGGSPSKPFNIRTVLPEPGNHELAEKIRELSRQKYTRNREEVETAIYKRLRE